MAGFYNPYLTQHMLKHSSAMAVVQLPTKPLTMCQLSRETLYALHQCQQRAIALYHTVASNDQVTVADHRQKSIEALNEEFGEEVVERMFRNGIGSNPCPKPAASPTFIANTVDGVPVFWGKDTPGAMDSPDLQFWITVGYPDATADNYRRVPYFLECVCSNMGYKQQTWTSLVSTIVANVYSDILLEWTDESSSKRG